MTAWADDMYSQLIAHPAHSSYDIDAVIIVVILAGNKLLKIYNSLIVLSA